MNTPVKLLVKSGPCNRFSFSEVPPNLAKKIFWHHSCITIFQIFIHFFSVFEEVLFVLEKSAFQVIEVSFGHLIVFRKNKNISFPGKTNDKFSIAILGVLCHDIHSMSIFCRWTKYLLYLSITQITRK